MKKKQKFPTEHELHEVRSILSEGPAARPLPRNADNVEKLKYSICAEFVKYKNKNRITQKELAEQLGIDEALVSKIVNYAYDEFTVDRLLKYLTLLCPATSVQLRVA